MIAQLTAWGVPIPTGPELVEAAIALLLAVIALAAGWLAGRMLGKWLTDLWINQLGGKTDGIGPRIYGITRHGTAAVLLAILAGIWHWHLLAALGLAFAGGSALAMLTVEVLRGLRMPRWIAWTMGGLAFFSTLGPVLQRVMQVRESLAFPFPIPLGTRTLTMGDAIKVVVTIVILIAIVRLATRVATHVIERSRGYDPTQKLLAQKLASIAAIVLAFFIGLDLLRIDLTAFAFFSGAFGLAIGFGMQKTIGNLIAGIILLMDRSIKPGDVIVVGDSFGWVNKIGVRAVSVVTRDGKEHLIPNEDLMTREVENWSYTDRNVRIRIPVRVAYDCDLKLAQELMLRAAQESPRVLDAPRSNVWLTAFGDNGVEHDILVWINDPEGGVGNVKSDVLNRLWVLFKEHDIRVPFPQREVRMAEPEAKRGRKAK